MKTLLLAYIICMNVLLESCEPPATFDKPQPDNVNSLPTFPERLQGKYLSSDQASILLVTNKVITRHYDFEYKEHKDNIGSLYKIVGDTLVNLSDNTKEKVIIRGDSIIQHFDEIDTLFSLSSDNILKKFKGHYFLSNRFSDNEWEVKKLNLQNGKLTIGSISSQDDIKKLKEITESTSDSTSTKFTLTRRQFKKFINHEGFDEQVTFIRMK